MWFCCGASGHHRRMDKPTGPQPKGRLSKVWDDVRHTLLDLVFPPRCLGCGATGTVLCMDCAASIQAPAEPLCPRCGHELDASAHTTAAPCAVCARGEGPTALDALRAAAVHEGVARRAVLALKYQGHRRAAQPLSDLLALTARRMDRIPDVIVPVPLHANRRRDRGYDQALLLAVQCARRLGVTCAQTMLVRLSPTLPQVGLSAEERRANVAGAFTASEKARALEGKRVLLIDDVTTTGSTLDAAAHALRPFHPREIWGLAVTRPDLASDSHDARQALAGRDSATGSRARGERR